MKILSKQGHREASLHLIERCKELSAQKDKDRDKLTLISSESLCSVVGSQTSWWRDASPVVKSQNVHVPRLSALRFVEDDKNLSDFRASLAIYEVLGGLPPAAAVDWTLWAGLAFGPCSEYMKARWHVPAPVVADPDDAFLIPDVLHEDVLEDEVENKPKKQRDTINRARGILLQRWVGRGAGTTALTRHGVGRLWWIARVAEMASREPQAEGKTMTHYLRILFADQNIQWSIVLRRYGAMSRLVSVLLDKIASDYLDQSGVEDRPYSLAKGKSINEVKGFTKLLNTSAGGSLYDLKDYSDMAHDVVYFQKMIRIS